MVISTGWQAFLGLAFACSQSSLEPSGSVIVSSSPWKQINGKSTEPRSAHKASVAARYSVAFLARVQPCQTRGSAQHGSRAHWLVDLRVRVKGLGYSACSTQAMASASTAAGTRDRGVHGDPAYSTRLTLVKMGLDVRIQCIALSLCNLQLGQQP